MKDSLLEKQNPTIRNDNSISEEINNGSSTKLLYIKPPLTFPNLFLNHKDIIIDEFGLKGIPKENKGKLTFLGID